MRSAVALDQDGSIYAAGSFTGQLVLGGQSLTAASEVVTYGRFFGQNAADSKRLRSARSRCQGSPGGELLARLTTSYPNSMLLAGSLSSALEGSNLVGSWSGELEIAGEKLISPTPGSLLFSRLAYTETLSAPRQFSVPGVSLISQDTAVRGESIWVAARWIEPDSDEHDVFVARFEP
jgi:hypothetical protein